MERVGGRILVGVIYFECVFGLAEVSREVVWDAIGLITAYWVHSVTQRWVGLILPLPLHGQR